jgi:hypothetical protein
MVEEAKPNSSVIWQTHNSPQERQQDPHPVRVGQRLGDRHEFAHNLLFRQMTK